MKFKCVSELIGHMMTDNNLTQTELSKKSGINKSSINEYLKGVSEPNIKSFLKLVDACGYKIVLKRKVR